MNEPIRKQQPTSLGLGRELLADALPDWQNRPREALARALEKAQPDAAADLILAAACAIASAAVTEARAAGRQGEGLALFEVELELERLTRELDEYHRARCAWWEKRA